MIAITKHADKRIKERVPGMKSAEKRMAFAECAWRLGVHRGEAGAAADAYLGRREEAAEAFADEYAGRDVVLYRDFLFVFEEALLITVLPRDEAYCRRIAAGWSESAQNSAAPRTSAPRKREAGLQPTSRDGVTRRTPPARNPQTKLSIGCRVHIEMSFGA